MLVLDLESLSPGQSGWPASSSLESGPRGGDGNEVGNSDDRQIMASIVRRVCVLSRVVYYCLPISPCLLTSQHQVRSITFVCLPQALCQQLEIDRMEQTVAELKLHYHEHNSMVMSLLRERWRVRETRKYTPAR